ncbi:MAG: hypothetical protein ACR2FY_03150 [Pirellulaceae bacterium]
MTITTLSAKPANWIEDFGRSWNEFWFRFSDPTLVSLLRIGVGVVALLHLASYTGDLVRWFATDGLLPPETVDALLGGGGTFFPTYLSFCHSPTAIWILHACGTCAALSLTFGLFSRTSAAITALATLAITNRAPVISGQVEPVLVFMLLYLCIAPSGARFALDACLRPMLAGQPFSFFVYKDEPSVLANLSLRLMQVHLAAFYLMMGLSKTYGEAWWDGAAAWHLIAQTHSRPVDLSFLRSSEFFLNAWTHFIAWTQLMFPFLVWNRFSRPLILAVAALMWLTFLPLTGLSIFSLLMLVGLACYLPSAAFARRHTDAKE